MVGVNTHHHSLKVRVKFPDTYSEHRTNYTNDGLIADHGGLKVVPSASQSAACGSQDAARGSQVSRGGSPVAPSPTGSELSCQRAKTGSQGARSGDQQGGVYKLYLKIFPARSFSWWYFFLPSTVQIWVNYSIFLTWRTGYFLEIPHFSVFLLPFFSCKLKISYPCRKVDVMEVADSVSLLAGQSQLSDISCYCMFSTLLGPIIECADCSSKVHGLCYRIFFNDDKATRQLKKKFWFTV